MPPGSRWVYRENGQRIEVTVTNRTKKILGIGATVFHDVVTEDGELVEDTYDGTHRTRYRDVLVTKDWTPLEPEVLEHKFYARGVGPVLVVAISGGSGREELLSFAPEK